MDKIERGVYLLIIVVLMLAVQLVSLKLEERHRVAGDAAVDAKIGAMIQGANQAVQVLDARLKRVEAGAVKEKWEGFKQ